MIFFLLLKAQEDAKVLRSIVLPLEEVCYFVEYLRVYESSNISQVSL